MMKIADVPMGKRVRCWNRMFRSDSHRERYWYPFDYSKHPFEGWVVGIRWLPRGEVVWHGPEDPIEWRAKGKPTPVLLVCLDPRTRGVYVPLDGYELVEEKPEPEVVLEVAFTAGPRSAA